MKISDLLYNGYKILKPINEETYMADCQLMLCEVLNKDKLFIMLNRDFEVDDIKCQQYFDMVELRKNKMPVKYILGHCDFMGLSFFVKEGVLIPRPDTEVLVEEVLKEIEKNGYTKICDVCTGSGAIGISIAQLNKKTQVECFDISEIAEEVTNKNIQSFKLSERVSFVKSDLLQYIIDKEKKFDVIVSNPPYIRRDEIPKLMEDVKDFEPYIALCGGDDGLDFYRKITSQSLIILNNGGLLAYEIGYDQGKAVQKILVDSGFTEVKCLKDFAGNDRVVTGKYFC